MHRCAHGESPLEDEDGQRDHERHGGRRCKMPGRQLLEPLRHESPQSAGRVISTNGAERPADEPGGHGRPPVRGMWPPVAERGPPVPKVGPSATEAGPVGKARPPVGKARPPVAKAGPPVGKAGPPVGKARPPVAKAGPPVAKAGPPVTESGPPLTECRPPMGECGPTPVHEHKPPVGQGEPPVRQDWPPVMSGPRHSLLLHDFDDLKIRQLLPALFARVHVQLQRDSLGEAEVPVEK
jgi:hypothetical protein